VSQTRDVAFEVEDALDDFFYQEEVRPSIDPLVFI
jgi:hypothetical protein